MLLTVCQENLLLKVSADRWDITCIYLHILRRRTWLTFPKIKTLQYPQFGHVPFAANEAAVKDQIYGYGERGDADIDVREDEERSESWRIFCAIKEKLAKEDICASLEHPSAVSPDLKYCFPGVSCIGSYMLLLTLRRLASQLEVVFLLLVDHSENYTLRSKTSITNEPFMKTQVTYFLW